MRNYMKGFRMVLLVLLVCIYFTGCRDTRGEVQLVNPTTFVFSGNANIAQWDPQNESRGNTTMLMMLMYDFLIRPSVCLTYMEPMLAESWVFSDDGLELTFNLRRGVYFHNGEEFDSASVVTTFQRFLDNPTLNRAPMWSLLESVRAVDKYTAVLRFSEPWGAVLATATEIPMLPPRRYAEMGADMFLWDATRRPVGTGPWIPDVWLPGGDAEFVRNDNYWGWGNNMSTFERIIYRPLPEDTSRVAGIQTGDLSMVNVLPAEMGDLLDRVPGISVLRIPTNAIIHLGFRTCEADGNYRVFNDIRARQAVMHAIDQQGINDAIAGGAGASNWSVPPGVIGHDSARAFEWEYNPALARELLSQTNYAGQRMVFMVPMGVFARATEVAQAIEAMLTAVGFNVDMQIMENAAFQVQRAAADYDLYIQRYGFPAGDPDNAITMRWLYDVHMSGYVNEELNNLIRASKIETNPVRREQILKDTFYVQWNTLAPHAALFVQINTAAHLNGISGLRVRFDDVIDYSRVTFIPPR